MTVTGGAPARCAPAVLLLAAWSLIASVGLFALEVPFLEGRVNDLAGLLDATAEERLEQKLAAFELEKGSQVAVLTVPSLEGDNLEDFSIRVVETWELGRAGVDDGVLLLVAQAERQLRLEVGYGLEGALPDALARRIVDNVVTPRFRDGDFAGGIEAGVDAVLQVVRGEELPAAVTNEPAGDGFWGCFPFVMVLFFVLINIVSGLQRSNRRRRRGEAPLDWSSRRGGTPWIFTGGGSGGRSSWGGGGGGFSGGGGGFGGGGASGSW